jgi:hypothetical protein
MTYKLTYAQAETLAALSAAGVIDNEISFNPYDIFPARDNADNGKRRCVTALARKGLLVEDSHQFGFYRPVVAECRAAWDEWRQGNPDAEFWF